MWPLPFLVLVEQDLSQTLPGPVREHKPPLLQHRPVKPEIPLMRFRMVVPEHEMILSERSRGFHHQKSSRPHVWTMVTPSVPRPVSPRATPAWRPGKDQRRLLAEHSGATGSQDGSRCPEKVAVRGLIPEDHSVASASRPAGLRAPGDPDTGRRLLAVNRLGCASPPPKRNFSLATPADISINPSSLKSRSITLAASTGTNPRAGPQDLPGKGSPGGRPRRRCRGRRPGCNRPEPD